MTTQGKNSKNTFIKNIISNWITLNICLAAKDEEGIKLGTKKIKKLVVDYINEHKDWAD
jgi:hypothetical protein